MVKKSIYPCLSSVDWGHLILYPGRLPKVGNYSRYFDVVYVPKEDRSRRWLIFWVLLHLCVCPLSDHTYRFYLDSLKIGLDEWLSFGPCQKLTVTFIYLSKSKSNYMLMFEFKRLKIGQSSKEKWQVEGHPMMGQYIFQTIKAEEKCTIDIVVERADIPKASFMWSVVLFSSVIWLKQIPRIKWKLESRAQSIYVVWPNEYNKEDL